jgi:hypothetical protein
LDVPVRTIERDELRLKIARGDQFKLVMSLNEWAFDGRHIPGSIHFNTPDEHDDIGVYCSNPDCLASRAVYRRLG